MKQFAKSGAALAAAALSFAVTGVTLQTAQAEDAKVQCLGVNACKGQSECKSGNHACKGLNECKTQGMMTLSKAECDAKGGKIEG